MPKPKIQIHFAKSTSPYEATAIQSHDGGANWTEVLTDDEPAQRLVLVHSDKDMAFNRMVDALVEKFPDDGFELDEP